MNLCGCGRLSVNFLRYFTSSRRVHRILKIPPFSITCRPYYRRGQGVVFGRITNLTDAETCVSSLDPRERRFLNEALQAEVQQEQQQQDNSVNILKIPTVQQLRLAGLHSAVPFIGFGFLDNAIMIVAGEYIDITIGVTFGISTMAAAALGNIISDVSGVGLAHYVELAANKLGFEGPGLSSKQMELPRTRFVTNIGRAIGLVVGCLLGMFPLLLLSTQEKEKESSKS